MGSTPHPSAKPPAAARHRPSPGEAAYGCVDWYIYEPRGESGDEPPPPPPLEGRLLRKAPRGTPV